MTRIAVAGAGRMGQAIVRLAGTSTGRMANLSVTSIWARDPKGAALELDADILVSSDFDAVLAGADVLIDFSLPEATNIVLDAAVRNHKPLVSGVSGLDAAQMVAVNTAANEIPLLYDRNMSQGIAILEAVIRDVATAIGPQFAVEIHETHHVHKKDAPSGTALKLGEAIVSGRGSSSSAEIHFESERQGDVPGDHNVILASATERLEFRHSVTTREVFAEGALLAAHWLAGREIGRYSMQDVLFGD